MVDREDQSEDRGLYSTSIGNVSNCTKRWVGISEGQRGLDISSELKYPVERSQTRFDYNLFQ